MRITNSMMSKSFLRDLNRNQGYMKKINDQLTSGKEISRPSDNPYKVARSMQLSGDIGASNQYNENIKDTSNWLDTTDTALQQLEGSMQRVRELMVSSGNAAYGSDERKAIKDEINEKINEMSQILNTTFDGKYIFGGTKVSSKPVAVGDGGKGNNKIYFSDKDGNKIPSENLTPEQLAEIEKIKAPLEVEVSQGVKMEYNVSALDVLKFTDSDGTTTNLMDLLGNIVDNLDDPALSDKIINENLADMDKSISNVLKIMSEVGAKQNRMESAATQNEEQIFNLTDILSKTEDIDLAEKTIEATVAQSIYMAALQVSARVVQPSLLDFL